MSSPKLEFSIFRDIIQIAPSVFVQKEKPPGNRTANLHRKRGIVMFWESFYALCKSKGTSPNAVCKEIGLSNAAATGWKNGTLPKADILVKIADHLECSIDALCGRSFIGLEPASESEWISALHTMSDESLIQLRDYVRFLLWKQAQDGAARQESHE